MSDNFIVFENWPINFNWLTNYESERARRGLLLYMQFEKHFSHKTIEQKAKIMGISYTHYFTLRNKYQPLIKEEEENEEIINSINDYCVR